MEVVVQVEVVLAIPKQRVIYLNLFPIFLLIPPHHYQQIIVETVLPVVVAGFMVNAQVFQEEISL